MVGESFGEDAIEVLSRRSLLWPLSLSSYSNFQVITSHNDLIWLGSSHDLERQGLVTSGLVKRFIVSGECR